MLSGLVQEIEEYIIPETDTCSKYGSELKIIGKRIVRTEVEFVPANLKVKQIVQQAAKCSKCGTDESEYGNCHFQKAAVPSPPLAHSIYEYLQDKRMNKILHENQTTKQVNFVQYFVHAFVL